MAYYIAIRSGTGYVILPEVFGVRSNAERHARRRRWEGYFIATEGQRLTIEANQYPSEGREEMQTPASQIRANLVETGLAMPDENWMREQGIPWNKGLRSKKKKR